MICRLIGILAVVFVGLTTGPFKLAGEVVHLRSYSTGVETLLVIFRRTVKLLHFYVSTDKNKLIMINNAYALEYLKSLIKMYFYVLNDKSEKNFLLKMT